MNSLLYDWILQRVSILPVMLTACLAVFSVWSVEKGKLSGIVNYAASAAVL